MFAVLAEDEEPTDTEDQTEEKPRKPPLNLSRVMYFVSEYFYGQKVMPM